MIRLIYSPHYNLGFFGIERGFHRFDTRKYGRAWRVIRRELGRGARRVRIRPWRPVRRRELLRVHSKEYLARLRNAETVAQIIEVPPLGRIPGFALDWTVLRPMRWAVAGTILGMRAAIEHGLAINLAGGFHHAQPSHGEGFSVYADAAIAIRIARDERLIPERARIAYIDLDAHHGNGVASIFRGDSRVFLFDMFNIRIYPCFGSKPEDRIDCPLPISDRTTESQYLGLLRERLPGFLDSISSREPVGLAIYNAGTDVFEDDPLGGLHVSADVHSGA